MVLLTVPVVAALVVGLAGLVPAAHAWLGGALASATALLLPGLWLGGRIRARRKALLKGLPDALDALVLCVEGGLSLRAAVQRITAELQTAHPALATEMTIVQREIELGQSAGEAMRSFARRAKLTEVQTLAAVLLQAEEYGSGIARTLRVHADVYRQQRQQRAEEQAQKAAVKILFPTLLCIFPAIFIVILGPALVQIQEMFAAR
jgi:tight adherence protein C